MEALGIGEIFLLYTSLLILALKLFSSWVIGLALWFGAIGVGIWRIQRRHSHWKKLGVPGPSASLLFENEGEIFTKGFHVIDEEWTSEYGETYGSYMSKKADLCTSNLGIIRQALIKKFHCFSDRLQVFGAGTEKDSEDDLLGHTLLSMPGPKWKSVRAQIVPVFTSAQIKQMVPIFDESSRLTVELIHERLDGNLRAKVELKDAMSRLTLDMIAKSGFGEDFNVQRDVDSPFVKAAHEYTNFTLTDVLPFMLFPNIMIELQYRLGKVLMKRESNGFFLKQLEAILDRRRAEASKQGNNGTERDFISLLLRSLQDDEPRSTTSEDADIVQAEVFDRKSSQSLSRMEIVAQAFIFLLASYDEASTTLSLMLYHLACFPDIQERVYKEIINVVGNDETVSAEQVAHLQYIEQVMCETMRIYPPAPRLNRICVEDTELNGIPMRAGDSFSVPVRIVHFNPKFYPEPEKFDPERFSPAAKSARDPLTFLPFGAGPRNCLGQRVAQFQIRTAVAHLIRAFKLELVDDSPKLPIRFTTIGPFRIVDSLNVHFVARN